MHFMPCNFLLTSFDVLNSLPYGSCRLISFQFPDPWRRGKHIKRQIIQQELVDCISKFLTIGACVYFSSDCDHVATRIFEIFSSSKYFDRLDVNNIQHLMNHITANTFHLPDTCKNDLSAYFNGSGWLKYNPLVCNIISYIFNNIV